MRHKQIFQADTPERWNRFKWISRVILVVLIIGAVAAALTITEQTYPKLPNLNPAPKRISDENLENYTKSVRYKEYKIDKRQLENLEARRRNQLKHANNKERINAAFYREWETQAYNSLKENISRLDMVVSEGFFIKPGADTIEARIDTGLLHINKKYNKPIVVSISNYINQDNISGYFDTKDVVRIASNKELRKVFINSLAKQLKKYKLRGINLDINNLPNRNNGVYRIFQEDLYNILHPQGFLVTQNVIPDDDQYDLMHLQRFNDYLFVMAMDQHTEESNAGDISHQHWVEEQLDRVCSIVPSEKVILTIAGGGVDWPENSEGTSVGYQAAVSIAQQFQSKVIYDPVSANLHYKYRETDSIEHTVYFVDAAANFNVMRMADDWGTAGVALWRLGAEDPRLWKFFQKNLALASLKKTGFDISQLDNVALNNKIDYTGNGEVLEIITTPSRGKINLKLDKENYVFTDQTYIKLPTKYVIKKFGYKPGKVVLTFDDGPDPDFTPRILEILKKENVPASFFVVGGMVEKNIPLLRRIFNEGYEIGNHTYLHPDISKVSLDRVILELNATRKLIESITGHSTILFRPPFNADAEPQTLDEVIPVAESRKQNYITIGESIDPRDWEEGVTAQQIIDRVKHDYDKGSMILLHDAGGDTREATVQALPEIIRFYKQKGYEFTTIADVLGKTKQDLMPPIQDDADSGIISWFYDAVVVGLFYGNMFLFYVFLSAIFLAIGRIVLIGILAIRQHTENKKIDRDANQVPVSIIVPAYNEEVTVIKTIKSLLNTAYPVFEIIFIDDGSTDDTYNMVKREYGDNPLVTVLTKPNGGKASALNFGIGQSKYDFVVCIDADTQLKNDAVHYLMTYFTDEEIGAVAGTVKVGNENNIITKWQAIEYITAQNMDRRAFDLINSITVIPGAIGAFRKSAISEAGGFTSDTLAEDCDLTMRILKCGYIVRNAAEAVAYTEAPETLEGLLKQRFRWSFGVIQSFWKNRKALLNKKYKSFGMVGMPNILIFQIVLPLFSPLADLMMIFGLFGEKPEKILMYYLLFVLIDFIVSIIAFRMEKEDYKKLVYIIPQRFVWRQLMYYILFKAIRKALKGELNAWGNLKRTGNVKASE